MKSACFHVVACMLLWYAGRSGEVHGEIAANLPQPKHDLHFTNVVTRWDEALPLGNGILGALVWGDGRPLKISLDRTDLWDLTPVPEFQSPDYNLATVKRLHKEGRHQELIKLLERPYNRPAPTRIPAGRIELDLADAIAESALSLTGCGRTCPFQ